MQPSCSWVPNPPMDDETVGLHLQQAVEKAAKALLTWKTKAPVTHDIDTLLQALTARGGPVPGVLDLGHAHAFATQARYERVVPPGSFDRACLSNSSRFSGVDGYLA